MLFVRRAQLGILAKRDLVLTQVAVSGHLNQMRLHPPHMALQPEGEHDLTRIYFLRMLLLCFSAGGTFTAGTGGTDGGRGGAAAPSVGRIFSGFMGLWLSV